MLKWAIACSAAGMFCYVLHAYLMKHFLDKKDPGILERDSQSGPRHAGRYEWEQTAGLGIVPKYVSFVGLCGMGLFILGVVLLLVLAVRAMV